MQDYSTIDSHLLDILIPPQQFPPTQQSLLSQLENRFMQQCQNFIQKQRHLYKYSHKVQMKLSRIKQNLNNLQSKVFNKQTSSQKSINDVKKVVNTKQNEGQSQIQRIFNQLSRINQNQKKFKERQELLQVLCKHLKMQKFREVLLTDKKCLGLQAQPVFLETLEQLRKRLQQAEKLTPARYSSLPLIDSMQKQFTQIYKIAVNKILSNFLTPTMLDLLLKKYSKIFFVSRQLLSLFYEALINNRCQYIKLGLYPLINTLNYAQNVADLYQNIVEKWIQMLRFQSTRFQESKIQPYFARQNQNSSQKIEFPHMKIIQTISKQTLNQFLPKLQRNVYKIKKMQQITKIRSQLRKLRFFFKSYISKQQPYESLEIVIKKVSILLQEKIKQQAEVLQNSKYNIYSLTSYLPIRQHLQAIKQCIKIQQSYKNEQKKYNKKMRETNQQKQQTLKNDFKQQEENKQKEIQKEQGLQQIIDKQQKDSKINRKQQQQGIKQLKIEKNTINWQLAIKRLTESRNPKLNPNNKSLIIFNLNTWFLYGKLLKIGSLIETARQTLDWSTERFIEINMFQTNKIYFKQQKLEQILDNCADIPSLKKVLYAELNLIGHQQLRKLIAIGLQKQYLSKYEGLLGKMQQTIPQIKNGLNHQQLLQICKQNKIHLKKFGKFAQKLEIFTVQSLNQLIQYN